MFKARLGLWGLNKNSKNNDWGAIAKLHKIRKESGKFASEFLVHGRKRTLAQLRKHIKSKSMSDQDFLAAAIEIEIPPYIRCYTPEAEEAADPKPATGTSQSGPWVAWTTPPATDAFLSSPVTRSGIRQLSVASLLHQQSNEPRPLSRGHVLSDADVRTQSPARLPNEFGQQQRQCASDHGIITGPPSSHAPHHSGSIAARCQHIQNQLNRMAEQALVPSAMQQSDLEVLESWVYLTNPLNHEDHDLALNCSKCNQSVSSHLNTLDDYVQVDSLARAAASPLSPASSIITNDHRAAALKWVVRCFSACIYMTHGTSNLAAQSLVDAEGEVENMLTTNNPLTLTSLNLILSILHVHDQGQIVESIVGSALKVASNVLGCTNPITVTIAWMTAAAGQKLPQPGLDANALRCIYRDFAERLGDDHPHSITALYNLSWNLIIDDAWDEAESNLRRLHQTSCHVLGSAHMQSITALTSLSRVLSNQDKNESAIEIMQEAIERSKNTLGPSHPYRLESKRRLALIYEKINDKPRMESMYWDVLRGRVKMLGPTHPYTVGAKVDLEQLLHDLGKWDAQGRVKAAIDALFDQQDDFKSWHEAF
jgi:Tetratricopeptide repeat